MAIPDYQTVMLPLLRAAKDGEVRVGDVVATLSDEFDLTAEEREQSLPSGRQKLMYNRIQWAKTYLREAGLLEATRRAHFKITDRGKQALAEDLERIDNNYLSQFEEFVAFKQRSKPVDANDRAAPAPAPTIIDEDRTPDEVMREAHQRIEEALRREILDRILANDPAFFEQLVVDLLVAMGYGGPVTEAGKRLGRSGDDGVDGVIDQDALGLDRVYVQAKRYGPGNNVGAPQVREFSGSLGLHKATKGLFVTTSSFTRDAVETADNVPNKIVLIDGDQLAGLMIRYNVGARTEETLALKKIDEDFFPE